MCFSTWKMTLRPFIEIFPIDYKKVILLIYANKYDHGCVLSGFEKEKN